MLSTALPRPDHRRDWWHPARWPRETRDTLFMLGLIAWIVLPQVRHLPLWCNALVALVLLWRGLLALAGRPLPGRLWRLGLLAVVVVATALTYRTLAGPDAGTTLLVSLLALKTLELRARRDALVIFFLGFFTILIGFLHSQSLPVTAAMLIGLWGLLTALVNAHRPAGTPRLRESARIALRMTLVGAPVMVALFLFFPRFAPLWSIPSDSTGRTGLSQNMTVGQVARLAQDDGVALRIRFDEAQPALQDLYFRGPVLSHFDGSTWTAMRGSDLPPPSPPPADLQVSGPAVHYTATLEPSGSPWLLTLDATASRPELPAHWQARQTSALQWVTRGRIDRLLRYSATSHVRYHYGTGASAGGRPHGLERELQLPPERNPRTLALGQRWRQEAGGDARAQIRLALQQLRRGGYVYTLEPGTTGADSADEFWFDTRAGFCEHIASAFVIAMRAGGVPARIVTGFQGGEPNGVGGYWIVRNLDAHAWAEVWLPDRGWMRVDPTAAVMPGRVGEVERLRPAPGMIGNTLATLSPNLLYRLRLGWDAVNNHWNQWVLDYTQQRQLDLLRKLGFKEPSRADLGRVLALLLVLATVLVGAWARVRPQPRDPWLQLLEQVRRRLRRQGLHIAPNSLPRELMQQVGSSTLPPALRRQLQAWLATLERQRYGQPQAGQPSAATLGRTLRRLPWPGPGTRRTRHAR